MYIKRIFFLLTGLLLVTTLVYSQVDMEAIQKKLPVGERQSRLDSLRVKWKRISDSLSLKLNGSGFKKEFGKSFLTSIVNGFPIYSTIYNNEAAQTIGTDKVQNSGLTGSSFLNFNIAIWDEGQVRTTHQELIGRVSNQTSQPSSIHSTHVIGTILASGINSNLKGMAPNATGEAYSFKDNNLFDIISLISGVYPNGLISNHSYGEVLGWNIKQEIPNGYLGIFPSYDNEWVGELNISNRESCFFGMYSGKSQNLDMISYDYPNHLMVFAAANDGNNKKKSPSNNTYITTPLINNSIYSQIIDNSFNAPPDYAANSYLGYDMLPLSQCSKNILLVGAVKKIPNGFLNSSQIELCDFSSTGPTDDGRIKPDIVAPGFELRSIHPKADDADTILSGTSMAAPVVTGSCVLLQQKYFQKTGSLMNSASLKGLVIHTADSKNPRGAPDYKYGWGLMNTYNGYQFINSLNEKSWLLHSNITQFNADTITFYYNGLDTILATLSWTDPPGVPATVNILDDPTPKLINDLDMQIYRQDINGNKVIPGFYPYTMHPNNPILIGTPGNNKLDNVEKIFISNKPAGFYTLVVSHKNTLQGQGNSQNYSLLVSGASGLLVKKKPFITFESFQHNYNEITWDDFSSLETQYRIERKIDGENSWYSLGTVPANVLLFRDSSIVPEKIHYYRIVAENQNQTVSQTNEASVLTDPPPAIASNLILSVVNNAPATRTLQLQWQDNADNETDFVIEVSRDGHNFELLDTVNAIASAGNTGQITHPNLPQNGSWFYRIKTVWNNFVSPYSVIIRHNFVIPASALSRVEYYFDTDPGFDMGYEVPNTAGYLAANFNSVSVPASLSNGVHVFYLRAKTVSGALPQWSNIYSASFLKLTAATNTVDIDSIEYYIDIDPGFGNGDNVDVRGMTGNQFTIPVDLSAVTTGLHHLYVRAIDNKGFWSNVYSNTFIRMPGAAGPPVITKLEYFIDNLAGFGSGVDVPVTSGASINQTVPVDLSGTAPGLHTVYLRAMDNAGKWSNVYSSNFLSLNGNGGSAAVKQIEYYFDTDPGFGNATAFNFPANAPKVIQDFNAPLNSLNDGLHTLYIRAKDQNGNWSNIYGNSFLKLTGTGGERKVIELQYTVDNGLLIGSGTSVSLTASNRLDISFTLPPLNNGKHLLSIKAKDNTGLYGNIYIDSFFVNDQQFCQLGSTVYYKSAINNGTTYQWQENAGNGWANLTDGGIFSSTGEQTLKIETPPTNWYGKLFRCIVDGVTDQEFIMKFSNTWTGVTNSDWFNTENWSCGVIPDEYVDVVIEQGVPNFPLVNSTGECRSLYLKSGVQLTIEAGKVLNIRGQ